MSYATSGENPYLLYGIDYDAILALYELLESETRRVPAEGGIFLTHLYHALNKHSYFQWVTTFERCVWHYRRLLGDYTMVFWMPPGSGSTLKAS